MAWAQRLDDALRAPLLAISAYAKTAASKSGPNLDDENVERVRRTYGGQLSPAPTPVRRWYQADLETAELMADGGDLTLAGQLCRAMDRDGYLTGLMSTRAGGMVQLPKRFEGPTDMVDALQAGGEQARSTFDEMLPATELERFVADVVKLNVAVAELVPVEGRDYPVFVRRSPEYLVYRHSENQWYFRSIAGLIAITPGDGRWVLHLGGREAPWQGGVWRALARAYITKDHARLYRDNWEEKLAHPARVAVSPQGAGEEQTQKWFKKVMAWGMNTVFGVGPGYDVKLLESNGKGHESFKDTIAEQNGEFEIAIAGQTVTVTGGTGFANADIHRTIRADLIKATAVAVAHTINTQVLPAWVLNTFGADRLAECPTLAWDVDPPKDLVTETNVLVGAANAVDRVAAAFATFGLTPDVRKIATRFGVPLLAKAAPANTAPAKPKLELVPQKEAA